MIPATRKLDTTGALAHSRQAFRWPYAVRAKVDSVFITRLPNRSPGPSFHSISQGMEVMLYNDRHFAASRDLNLFVVNLEGRFGISERSKNFSRRVETAREVTSYTRPAAGELGPIVAIDARPDPGSTGKCATVRADLFLTSRGSGLRVAKRRISALSHTNWKALRFGQTQRRNRV